MPRRPLRPRLDESDKKRLLDAMRTVRNLAGLYGASAGYASPRNLKVRALGERIDDLAEELTGDRAYFHEKHHST